MCPPSIGERALPRRRTPLRWFFAGAGGSWTLCLLLLLAASTASCLSPAAPSSTRNAPRTMTTVPDQGAFGLGEGDILRVNVLGHPELSTPVDGSALDERGAIDLPYAGTVVVDGLTVAEAAARIDSAYGEFMKEPDVTVALKERRSKRYFVLGQIKEPGPRPIDRPLTALEALSQGGFFLNAADRRNVYLVRRHAAELEVHTFNAATPGPDGLIQVLPGDIVFVRRRGTQRFVEEFMPLLTPWQIALPTAMAAEVL